MRWMLALIAWMLAFAALANEAKPKAAAANQAVDARRKQLEIALADVCARHASIERCFLVVGKDARGRPGLWFVPVFDGAPDSAALGAAQQAWLRIVPAAGSLPMMLPDRSSWTKQLAGVPAIYVRTARR